MNDVLVFIGIAAGWIVLNLWILPWFGVQTCMSGACSRTPRMHQTESCSTADKVVHDSKTIRKGDLR